MRLAFCADVHLGNHKRFGGDVVASLNHRCRLVLGVLNDALNYAADEGCDHFVVCGDLFDSCAVLPQLVREVQKLFAAPNTPEVTVLMGNHEQVSTQEGDHALGPLRAVCEVDEKPTLWTLDDAKTRTQLLTLPHLPDVDASRWVEEEVLKLIGDSDADCRVLAVHMGIKDERTAPWLASNPGAIEAEQLLDIMERTGIEACFAGDWHDHRTWSRDDMRVVQLGALVPTGWDNPGLEGYGTVGIFDTATGDITLHHLPGPRFLKVAANQEPVGHEAHRLFLQVVAPPEGVQAAMARDSAGLEALEVVVDAEAAKAMARDAAEAARATGTLDEALAGFVEKMPLDEGVDRDVVLRLCQGYLK